MHFAMAKTAMTTLKGEETHALHGFCRKMLEYYKRWPAHRLLVAFDRPGGSAARLAILPDYKATRDAMPRGLRPQIDAMREACELLGAPSLAVDGYEADDLIAACVAAAREQGFADVIIASADKDLLQLVSDDAADPTQVSIWDDKLKKQVGAEQVVAKHGVRPRQVADLLALMGDSSDNVPGVPGVGAKTAATMLTDHGDLDAVLSAAAQKVKPSKREQALVEFAETARRARRLVTLDAEAPLDRAVVLGSPPQFDDDGLVDFLRRWELRKVEEQVAMLRRAEMKSAAAKAEKSSKAAANAAAKAETAEAKAAKATEEADKAEKDAANELRKVEEAMMAAATAPEKAMKAAAKAAKAQEKAAAKLEKAGRLQAEAEAAREAAQALGQGAAASAPQAAAVSAAAEPSTVASAADRGPETTPLSEQGVPF